MTKLFVLRAVDSYLMYGAIDLLFAEKEEVLNNHAELLNKFSLYIPEEDLKEQRKIHPGYNGMYTYYVEDISKLFISEEVENSCW